MDRRSFLLQVGTFLVIPLTSGCVVVGGYSSGRGWFIWPGTIVIFLILGLFVLLFKRR